MILSIWILECSWRRDASLSFALQATNKLWIRGYTSKNQRSLTCSGNIWKSVNTDSDRLTQLHVLCERVLRTVRRTRCWRFSSQMVTKTYSWTRQELRASSGFYRSWSIVLPRWCGVLLWTDSLRYCLGIADDNATTTVLFVGNFLRVMARDGGPRQSA